MKPNFALNLTPDAISLLYRTTSGWRIVGSAETESDDLSGDLAYLRNTAVGLAPKGYTTKLIIPASQILFTRLNAPEAGDTDPDAQIRAQLEGLTPYRLDELKFDWMLADGHAIVAAVAIETLSEAEKFAFDHGFNPVSFAAEPGDEAFSREVSFGITTYASELLAANATPEPDLTITAYDAPETAEQLDESVEEPIAADAPQLDAITGSVAAPAEKSLVAPHSQNGTLDPLQIGANASLDPEEGVTLTFQTFRRPHWPKHLRNEQVRIAPILVASAALIICVTTAVMLMRGASDLDSPPYAGPSTATETLEPPTTAEVQTPPTPSEPSQVVAAQPDTVDPAPVEQHTPAPEPIISAKPVQLDDTPPAKPLLPGFGDGGDLYLPTLDPVTTADDPIALPVIAQNPDLGRPVALETPAPPEPEVAPVPTPLPEEIARLAGFRPLSRPANLTEAFERSRFGGLSRTELAARRPVSRPDSPQTQTPEEETSHVATIQTSLRPGRRPANLDRVIASIKSSRAAEQQDAAANAAAASAAASTAAAIQTSPPRATAPNIPTSASVARQATIENGIDLRRTALIGVYGASNNRRALVRLRNGRYVRVAIGDRLDGGVVAAITSDTLQYTKGGRSVILQMPDT